MDEIYNYQRGESGHEIGTYVVAMYMASYPPKVQAA
jgi:hypothetical protein